MILHIKTLLNKTKQTRFCAESQNSPLKDILNTYLCRRIYMLFLQKSLKDILNTYLCRLPYRYFIFINAQNK